MAAPGASKRRVFSFRRPSQACHAARL